MSGAVHRECDRVGQFVFGRDICRRYREGALFDQILGDFDGCSGVRPQRLQRCPGALELMLELAREIRIGILQRQVGARQNARQRIAARQPKAARENPMTPQNTANAASGAQALPLRMLTMAMPRLHHDVDELTRHDDHFAHGRRAHELLHVADRPAPLRAPLLSSAPTATVIWPRSLPLTCTTSAIEEVCKRRLASTGVHGSSISALPWPSARHSACVTCGNDRRQAEHRDFQRFLHYAAVLPGALREISPRR